MNTETDIQTHPAVGYDYKKPNEYCQLAKISRATFWRQVKNNQIQLVRFGDRCPRVPVRESAPRAAA